MNCSVSSLQPQSPLSTTAGTPVTLTGTGTCSDPAFGTKAAYFSLDGTAIVASCFHSPYIDISGTLTTYVDGTYDVAPVDLSIAPDAGINSSEAQLKRNGRLIGLLGVTFTDVDHSSLSGLISRCGGGGFTFTANGNLVGDPTQLSTTCVFAAMPISTYGDYDYYRDPQLIGGDGTFSTPPGATATCAYKGAAQTGTVSWNGSYGETLCDSGRLDGSIDIRFAGGQIGTPLQGDVEGTDVRLTSGPLLDTHWNLDGVLLPADPLQPVDGVNRSLCPRDYLFSGILTAVH